MNLKLAEEFLNRCFSPEETIALLLRKENPTRVVQRIVKFESVLTRRYLAWLAYENSARANVYVAANPLRTGSRKRTKESIDCVRHLYVDLDIDGDARLDALRTSSLVPTPSAIVSTSPAKYQVLWQVAGFDFALQELTLKQLAFAFGGDPACTDCNRVLRVPGFFNRKYVPAFLVTAEYPCDSIWTPTEFQIASQSVNAVLDRSFFQPRTQSGKHSHSESDWAWVCRQIAHAVDAEKITQDLASRRSDKPNPLYYAQRTVDIASARIWLANGIGIDQVVEKIEARRQPELSKSLSTTRANEIAATARRMVERNNQA